MNSDQSEDRAFIQDLVINDIEDRKQFGINKYGQALQSGNGRDMVRDLYEELMDATIYVRGIIDEDHLMLLELQRYRREHTQLRLAVRRYIDEFYEDDQDGSRIQFPSELAKFIGWEHPDLM